VWRVERATGTIQRLTDHPGEDWDPGFTPDGKNLLWSSNRSGTFEVWMADADGAQPRQITRDGDGENPTATPDGQWIVYASGDAARRGIWRIRPDGTDAALLVPDVILPEVSPDGRYVLFQTSRSPRSMMVGVASVADGKLVPFEINIEVRKSPSPALGRARWMPDGRAIAFLGHDDQGRTGVFVQRFAPGEDTTAERRPLAGFGSERVTESFGIAPDGKRVVLAEWEQGSTVVAATGLQPR
jgi:Tol biopolymer transport system component